MTFYTASARALRGIFSEHRSKVNYEYDITRHCYDHMPEKFFFPNIGAYNFENIKRAVILTFEALSARKS